MDRLIDQRTAGRFNQYLANSPSGCSVADWTCPRFTSYIFPNSPLTDAEARTYTNQGFKTAFRVIANDAHISRIRRNSAH